jgi:hypothetical protein
MNWDRCGSNCGTVLAFTWRTEDKDILSLGIDDATDET